MSEIAGPARVLVAPIEVQPPKKVSDIIDMTSYDPKPYWHDLGASRLPITVETEPARLKMRLVIQRLDLLNLGKRSSRLVALVQDPDTKEVSGYFWPIATMHPVNPDDVQRALLQPDDLSMPVSFDASVRFEPLPREASAPAGS
jgi:hypothetical protein